MNNHTISRLKECTSSSRPGSRPHLLQISDDGGRLLMSPKRHITLLTPQMVAHHSDASILHIIYRVRHLATSSCCSVYKKNITAMPTPLLHCVKRKINCPKYHPPPACMTFLSLHFPPKKMYSPSAPAQEETSPKKRTEL